jgi:hypothetical protein
VAAILGNKRILYPFAPEVKRGGSFWRPDVPIFKHGNLFKQQHGPAFDTVHSPGWRVPFSGIYRCCGCGDEIASNKGTIFPSQSHRQHQAGYGAVRWQLVAAAVQL